MQDVNSSRSCEESLQVLRDNEESLMTVVQVLLFDPLYDWTLSPSKALRLQNVDSEEDASFIEDLCGGIGNLLLIPVLWISVFFLICRF
jgi:hypothetical protein